MSRARSPSDKRRIADLLVLILLSAFAALYCLDAVRASTSILNLILVLPLTILVLSCCAVQFVLGATRPPPTEPAEEPVADVLPIVGLFAAYVSSLPWLGFDVGTCLFIAACLYCQGERRWPWLLGYSLAFAFAATWFFARMLPYPMPMLVLDRVAGS